MLNAHATWVPNPLFAADRERERETHTQKASETETRRTGAGTAVPPHVPIRVGKRTATTAVHRFSRPFCLELPGVPGSARRCCSSAGISRCCVVRLQPVDVYRTRVHFLCPTIRIRRGGGNDGVKCAKFPSFLIFSCLTLFLACAPLRARHDRFMIHERLPFIPTLVAALPPSVAACQRNMKM